VVSAKGAHLDARGLEWIFRRENQYTMVLSASEGGIRRATLENESSENNRGTVHSKNVR
jgi:hypothetical protein